MTALQRNLKHQLSENNISAHALEKKAGLKPSAVQNILQGKSKRPSADLLQAVAYELGCSVSDLLSDSPPQKASPPGPTQAKKPSIPWDSGFYIEVLLCVQKLLQKREMKLTKDQVISLVDEVYSYSFQGSDPKPDVRFAEWLISLVN